MFFTLEPNDFQRSEVVFCDELFLIDKLSAMEELPDEDENDADHLGERAAVACALLILSRKLQNQAIFICRQ